MSPSKRRTVKNTLEFGRSLHALERPRTFLERNITAILKNHENLSTAPNALDSNGLDDLANGWHYDAKIMEMVTDSSSEMLKIEVKELTSCTTLPSPAEHHPARKRQKLLEPVYEIELKVWVKDPENGFDAVFLKKQDARLETAVRDGRKTYKISTLPFYVPRKNLEIKALNKKTKSSRAAWKKTPSKDCKIGLKFTFMTDEDEKHFHEVTGGVLSAGSQIMTEFLSPTLSDFSNTPLPIHGSDKGKKHPLPLMLIMDIAWRTNAATPFVNFNQAANSSIMRVLTKDLVEHGHAVERCDLKYSYTSNNNKTKNLCFDRPKCLVCVDKQPFDSLDRLHFHLKTCHVELDFKFNKTGRSKDVSKVEVIVNLVEEAKMRVRNKKRSFGWIRPSQPFVLSDYLDGNEHWVDPQARRHTSSNAVTHFKAVDLPIMQKKKYRVPKAPGNRIYFRSSNKRPLIEGELLSESDDEIDEEWVKAKERSYVHDSRVTKNQKLLMQKLDEHMNNEFLNANVHVGDAISRFTEAHAAYLCETKLVREFIAKLNELQHDNIITADVGAQCGSFVREEAERIERRKMASHKRRRRSTSYDSDSDDDSMSSSSIDDTVMVDATVTEEAPSILNGSEVVSQTTGELSASNLCTCGKPPIGFRNTIMCKNAFCSRTAGFHLSCVGLEKRAKGWTCHECEPQKINATKAKKESSAGVLDVIMADRESIPRDDESQTLKSENNGDNVSHVPSERVELPKDVAKSQSSNGDMESRKIRNGRAFSPVGRSAHGRTSMRPSMPRTKSSLSREIKATDSPAPGSQSSILIDADGVDKIRRLELNRTEEGPSITKDSLRNASPSPQAVNKRGPLRTSASTPGVYWRTSSNPNSPREVHSDTPTQPPKIRRESPRGSRPRTNSPSGISKRSSSGRRSPVGASIRLSPRRLDRDKRRSPASRARGYGASSSHHP